MRIFALLFLGVSFTGCAYSGTAIDRAEATIQSGGVGEKQFEQRYEIRGGKLILITPDRLHGSPRYSPDYAPEAFLAVSLRRALEVLSTTRGCEGDCPPKHDIAFQLGGINQFVAAVIDKKTKDVVLVGIHDKGRPPVTLANAVTILKPILQGNRGPFVSIDPLGKTQHYAAKDPSTKIRTGDYWDQRRGSFEFPEFQTIRYDGSVKNTQIGAEMVDADFRLKLIGFGLLSSGVEEVDLLALKMNTTPDGLFFGEATRDRFEFKPFSNNVYYNPQIIFLPRNVVVGVETERMAGRKELSGLEKQFANAFMLKFREIGDKHDTIAQLEKFAQLYALGLGLQDAGALKMVSDALELYIPIPVRTISHLPTVTASVAGLPGWAQTIREAGGRGSGIYQMFVSGGVSLSSTSIAARLRPAALRFRTDVLGARLSREQLHWTVESSSTAGVLRLVKSNQLGDLLLDAGRSLRQGLFDLSYKLAEEVYRLSSERAHKERAILLGALAAYALKDFDNWEKEFRANHEGSVLESSTFATSMSLKMLHMKKFPEAIKWASIDGISFASTIRPTILGIAFSQLGDEERACDEIGLGPEIGDFFFLEVLPIVVGCLVRANDLKKWETFREKVESGNISYAISDFVGGQVSLASGRRKEALVWFMSFFSRSGESFRILVDQTRDVLANLLEEEGSRLVVPDSKGLVVFWRESEWLGNQSTRYVGMNGLPIGSLSSGEYFLIVIEPGEHTFTISGDRSFIGLRSSVSLEVNADEVVGVSVETKDPGRDKKVAGVGSAIACSGTASVPVDAVGSCFVGALGQRIAYWLGAGFDANLATPELVVRVRTKGESETAVGQLGFSGPIWSQ